MPNIEKITEIKANDFLKGFAYDCRQCPVALGLIRNNYVSPSVDSQRISYFNKSNKEVTKSITKGLSRKINSIDNQRPIKPFKIIERENRFSIYKNKEN